MSQWLLLIRFMVGIGLGGVPVAFALFAEFCPVAGRGGWLIALQAFWTFGSMAEAAVAWGVLVPLGWRVLLALSAAPFGAAYCLIGHGLFQLAWRRLACCRYHCSELNTWDSVCCCSPADGAVPIAAGVAALPGRQRPAAGGARRAAPHLPLEWPPAAPGATSC